MIWRFGLIPPPLYVISPIYYAYALGLQFHWLDQK